MRRTGASRSIRRVIAAPLMLALVGAAAIAPPAAAQKKPKVAFWLTILHNNDGESQLINAGAGLEKFGGVARFARVVENLKEEAGAGGRRGVIMVSSGDNYLAGPEFNASLEKGSPFYDTIGMDLIGYDAVAIGNHEFDFGPDVLADFIAGFSRTSPPFLSANLRVGQEPALKALARAGRIAKRTIVVEDGRRIGIVGATTPNLPFISSPRNVSVRSDVAAAIQTQVDALLAKGVNKIVLISHLQNIGEDLALAPMLRGVDVMVAGGGDEVLAGPNDLLIPGDETEVFGPYPLTVQDAAGRDVPVVTTSGAYRYVGRLMVGFNRAGKIVAVRNGVSGPVRVAGGSEPDAVKGVGRVRRLVTRPVIAAVDALAATVVGTSEVDLDGLRSNVRSMETNEGDLIADALKWQAEQLATSFGVAAPDVALQNGGGIRNDSVIPAGNISELDTFDMVPFPNFVSVLENIPRSQFKEILENAVGCTQSNDFVANPNCGSGRFAQISGFSFDWSASGVGQILNPDGTVNVPGTRVREVMLDDGTMIVTGGGVVAGPDVTVATIDFLARGGDQYPYRGAPFTALGATYQQAVSSYIQTALSGAITAADYPVGGEGRITELP